MDKRIRQVLNRKEAAAYEGLLSSSCTHDLHVFPKIKLDCIFDFEDSSLVCENPFLQHSEFDFVLSTKDYKPVLAVDAAYLAEPAPHEIERAELKKKICDELDIGYVRIDCSILAAYQVSEIMHMLVDEFSNADESKTSDIHFEYNGCLDHRTFCDVRTCAEFKTICAHLFSEVEEPKVADFSSPNLFCRTIDNGGLCESVISVLMNGTVNVLAKGQCLVSAQLQQLGKNVSLSLAASIASREIEDVRNHLFASDEPCSIDLNQKSKKLPGLTHAFQISHSGFVATAY